MEKVTEPNPKSRRRRRRGGGGEEEVEGTKKKKKLFVFYMPMQYGPPLP
jgi:hypothetical protein